MLSKEEKEAIEYFKSNLERTKEMGKRWGFQEEIKNNEIILNLIEKQQKEIEELKQNRDEYKEEYKKLLNARYYDYISKDKIREKIEELESLSKNITMQPSIYNYEIDLLKELLEEN